MRRLGIAFLLAACSAFTTLAQEPATAVPRFYAVVFGVQFEENGDVKRLRQIKVVDPRKGNADTNDVEVPDRFVEAVRKMLGSPRYRPKPGSAVEEEVYTYFFFDPKRPDRADLDPRPRAR